MSSALTVHRSIQVASLACGMIAGTVAQAQDCVAWAIRSTVAPSTGYQKSLAFDSARHRVVFYAGAGGTFEWDGIAWIQASPSVPYPPQFEGFAMAYDSARSRTVLFGGKDIGFNFPTSTWEWDGVIWHQVASAGPTGRYGATTAFDSSRGVVVLFGGGTSLGFNGETWEWDGVAWAQRASTGPLARVDHAMAFDSVRGRTVLFGGTTVAGGANDTWEWDGTQWTLATPTGMARRYSHAMAFDSTRGRTVLFGGIVDGVRMNDTWTWNGTSWEQESPSPLSLPAVRSAHALAYDSARDRLVLFGGTSGAQGYPVDTWEYKADRRLSITQQPAPQTAYSGNATVLTIDVVAAAPAFQWRRNGVNLSNGGRFGGVTSSSLVINPTIMGDAAVYDVAVSSLCGSAVSDGAALTVLCYPNCDGSTFAPTLNALDFGCFLSRFAGGDTYANCDGSAIAPVLNALDFGCFLTKFSAGCQ